MAPPRGRGKLMVAVWVGNGWHPALFRSEANALGKIRQILHPRVVVVSENNSIEHSAFIDQSLYPFEHSFDKPSAETIANWFSNIQPLNGKSIAVRASKMGNMDGISITKIQSDIGAILHNRGWSVNLENPDIEIILHYCGSPEKPIPIDPCDDNNPFFVWGILDSNGPGGFPFQNRSPTERPFFKPVSLDPRLARAMVNLCYTGGKPPNFIIDPFCGTGGIAIESAMIGVPVFASDLDNEMVQGTLQNLNQIEFGDKITVQSCNAIEIFEHLGHIEGAAHAFDPPYGRNSWTSDEGFLLFKNTVFSLSNVSRGPMVMLLPIDPEVVKSNPPQSFDEFSPFGVHPKEFQEILSQTDYKISTIHPIWVHRSLARALVRIDPI